MPTLLNLKEEVTNQLGADNASTTVSKRDKIINQARRQFYSARQWSFLFKSATVPLTAQVGSLPSDFNKKFSPIQVYFYTGDTKYQFMPVSWSDVSMYPEDVYVYAIDKTAGTIKTNQSSVTSLTMDYTYLPADRPIDTTEDSQEEPAPELSAIAYLAIAKWWLSSERGTGKYQMFMDEYERALTAAKAADMSTMPIVPINPVIQKIRTGYISRV